MKTRQKRDQGFTLVEMMIVVSIITILATIAVPAVQRHRQDAETTLCKNRQHMIFRAMSSYAIKTGANLVPAEWPNLCAARNRLAPGNSNGYLKDWKSFECPVDDSQDQHDYAYIVSNDGFIIGVRCNNADPTVRAMHNE